MKTLLTAALVLGSSALLGAEVTFDRLTIHTTTYTNVVVKSYNPANDYISFTADKSIKAAKLADVDDQEAVALIKEKCTVKPSAPRPPVAQKPKPQAPAYEEPPAVTEKAKPAPKTDKIRSGVQDHLSDNYRVASVGAPFTPPGWDDTVVDGTITKGTSNGGRIVRNFRAKLIVDSMGFYRVESVDVR